MYDSESTSLKSTREYHIYFSVNFDCYCQYFILERGVTAGPYQLPILKFYLDLLIHSFPMRPFSTHLKHQKTLLVSDVFRGLRKDALEVNGLI